MDEPKKKLNKADNIKNKKVSDKKDVNPKDIPDKIPAISEDVENDIENDLEKATNPVANIGVDSVSKIMIQVQDEITFVIDKIEEVKTKKLIISIPSGCDILVSTVGMNLISQTLRALKKKAVIVTDDNSGLRVAQLAGFTTRKSMSEVTDDIWMTVGKVSGEGIQNFADNSAENLVKENQPNFVLDSASGGESSTEGSPSVDESNMDATSALDDYDKLPYETSGKHDGGLADDSLLGRDFQDNIEKEESALHPQKKMIDNLTDGVKKVNVGDVEFTIDSQAPQETPPVGKVSTLASRVARPKPSLVGRDFSGYRAVNTGDVMKTSVSNYDKIPASGAGELTPLNGGLGGGKSGGGSTFFSNVLAGFTGFFKNFNFETIRNLFKSAKFIRILVVLIVVLLVGIVFMSWYLPEVVITLEVESVPVEYSGEISALTTVDEISLDNVTIPAKIESVETSGAKPGDSTGTAVEGEKATGTVNIYNNTDAEITIDGGTYFTTSSMNFILQGSVTVPKKPDPFGMGSASGQIAAEAPGPEYNIAGGAQFSVGSYALTNLYATNPSALSGGTKQEYRVVSQSDIDKLVESVKQEMFTSSKSDLQEKADGTRWVIVEESIKNEVVGDVDSDKQAGERSDTLNVSLKGKSSAVYYDKDAFDELISDLLLNDLDQDADVQDLVLSDDVEKTVTVTSSSVDDGSVVLSVTVSGFVMPQFDEEQIAQDLKGQRWAEGLKILNKMDFLAKDPEIEFYPEWFPGIFKKMPSRDGRITVIIKNVAPSEDQSEEDNTDNTENAE
ncbi:baseplate J/gp47 family protein [Candidatus Dojkabacteria bacterium]|nr:baseplate J/gp47 family protein [Candidatus Dojkabacteria bacterium]